MPDAPRRARAQQRLAFRCGRARDGRAGARTRVSGKPLSRTFGVQTACLLRPQCGRTLLTRPFAPNQRHSATLPPFRTPSPLQTLGGRWSQWRAPGRRYRRWPAREGRGAPEKAGRAERRRREQAPVGLCSSHRTPEPARGAGEGEGLGLAPPRAGPGLGGGAVLLSPRFLLPYPLVSLPRSRYLRP